MFTYHGVIMVFLVIIPAVPAALGNFFLPMHARSEGRRVPAAEPAFVLHLLPGAVFAVAARCSISGADTGWTFYAPYSIRTNTARDLRSRRARSSPASRRF